MGPWSNQFREIFYHSPVCIIVIDPELGSIVLANHIAQKMWGYSADELLTKSITELIYPSDLAATNKGSLQSPSGIDESLCFERQYFRKDGSHFWGESSVSPLKDESNKVCLLIVSTIDITVRKNEGSEFLKLFKSIPDLACIASTSGYFLYINSNWNKKLGHSEQELRSRPFLEFVHPQDQNSTTQQIERLKTVKEPLHFVNRFRCNAGNYLWLEWSVSYDADRKRLLAIARDITERKQTEADLRIASITFNSHEGVTITDNNMTIMKVNPTFTKITGYTENEVVGKNPRILSSSRQDARFYHSMWNSIKTTGTWEGRIWDRRKNGDIYPANLTISAVKDNTGKITNYVGIFTDSSETQAIEDQTMQMALYDTLTGLPSRRLLLDRLMLSISACERTGNEGALLFIDLDHFKITNDTLGYAMGDLLLQQVAERLKSCVRADDTVARIAGGQFVLILEGLNEHSLEAATQVEIIGQKVLDVLNQPYHLGRKQIINTCSIGITLFNQNQRELDELFQQADLAMYQAKKAGRNTLRFFEPYMQTAINARSALEKELRNAVQLNQFFLHYQVQVDHMQRPFGAEALIRWANPERGLLLPAEFIPVAEETGLILAIGNWVIDTACAQLSEWEWNEATRNLVLSVNVSAKQFRQPDFAAQIKTTLQRHGVHPARLKLEIIESVLLNDIESIMSTMDDINAIGVRFSLDDFGTGYSSLQHLKKRSLVQLKINQSFFKELTDSRNDKTIIHTIIAIAQSLNLDIIAEGVETEEQREFLENAGCVRYQGYLFGRPVQISHFNSLLANSSKDYNPTALDSKTCNIADATNSGLM